MRSGDTRFDQPLLEFGQDLRQVFLGQASLGEGWRPPTLAPVWREDHPEGGGQIQAVPCRARQYQLGLLFFRARQNSH